MGIVEASLTALLLSAPDIADAVMKSIARRRPVAADIAHLAKTQAPLAIKTREESVPFIEKFEELGFAGMCHHPAPTTRKEAVLVREVIHPPAAYYPVNPN
jgi:hypothetical protein